MLAEMGVNPAVRFHDEVLVETLTRLPAWSASGLDPICWLTEANLHQRDTVILRRDGSVKKLTASLFYSGRISLVEV